jgi:hypothetical protein
MPTPESITKSIVNYIMRSEYCSANKKLLFIAIVVDVCKCNLIISLGEATSDRRLYTTSCMVRFCSLSFDYSNRP